MLNSLCVCVRVCGSLNLSNILHNFQRQRVHISTYLDTFAYVPFEISEWQTHYTRSLRGSISAKSIRPKYLLGIYKTFAEEYCSNSSSHSLIYYGLMIGKVYARIILQLTISISYWVNVQQISLPVFHITFELQICNFGWEFNSPIYGTYKLSLVKYTDKRPLNTRREWYKTKS